MCKCKNCGEPVPKRRGGGILSTVFQIALLYAVLAFSGGTLVKTEKPFAVELGRTIHALIFVAPLIDWVDSAGHPRLAGGVRLVAEGVEIG